MSFFSRCATTNQFAPAHEGSPEILSNPVGNSPLKIYAKYSSSSSHFLAAVSMIQQHFILKTIIVCYSQTHVEKAPSALQATTDPDLIVQFVCVPQAQEETRFRDVPKVIIRPKHRLCTYLGPIIFIANCRRVCS